MGLGGGVQIRHCTIPWLRACKWYYHVIMFSLIIIVLIVLNYSQHQVFSIRNLIKVRQRVFILQNLIFTPGYYYIIKINHTQIYIANKYT